MSSLCIVMPVLNEGASLARRLQDLRPLRQRGVELVVVDGGSTDGTWAIACRHGDRVLLAPRGRAAQMNAGARHARSDTLLFLHADTTLPADADRLIEEAVTQGAQWGRFDVRIDSRAALLGLVGAAMNLRSRLSGVATGDQAIFVRRQVFEQIGGFPGIALMEDIALSERLKAFGRPACLQPAVATSGRRWERHGTVRTILLMWQLRARYFLGADPGALAKRYGYAAGVLPPPAAVAILAKAPIAGWAKTRLARSIGPMAAARAQRSLTRLALFASHQAALGPVTLWCAPDPRHRFFRALERDGRVTLLAQPAGDLGVRLQAAVQHHFAQPQHGVLLIVGTDCPLLSPGHLHQAAAALAGHDAVLVPAEDGGYALVGMRRPLPELFSEVAWSTAQVLQQTRERLRSLGATWIELEPLWDIDEGADWKRFAHLMGSNPFMEQPQ